jgi:hypothetical protein
LRRREFAESAVTIFLDAAVSEVADLLNGNSNQTYRAVFVTVTYSDKLDDRRYHRERLPRIRQYAVTGTPEQHRVRGNAHAMISSSGKNSLCTLLTRLAEFTVCFDCLQISPIIARLLRSLGPCVSPRIWAVVGGIVHGRFAVLNRTWKWANAFYYFAAWSIWLQKGNLKTL